MVDIWCLEHILIVKSNSYVGLQCLLIIVPIAETLQRLKTMAKPGVWHTLVIPTLGKVNRKFDYSLGYRVKILFQKKK